MMNGTSGTGYHYAGLTSSAPANLPGVVATVMLGDSG